MDLNILQIVKIITVQGYGLNLNVYLEKKEFKVNSKIL